MGAVLRMTWGVNSLGNVGKELGEEGGVKRSCSPCQSSECKNTKNNPACTP